MRTTVQQKTVANRLASGAFDHVGTSDLRGLDLNAPGVMKACMHNRVSLIGPIASNIKLLYSMQLSGGSRLHVVGALVCTAKI